MEVRERLRKEFRVLISGEFRKHPVRNREYQYLGQLHEIGDIYLPHRQTADLLANPVGEAIVMESPGEDRAEGIWDTMLIGKWDVDGEERLFQVYASSEPGEEGDYLYGRVVMELEPFGWDHHLEG